MQKQKIRICVDLTKLNESVQREERSALSRPDTRETGRGKNVHEAIRQFRVLANTSLAQFRRTYQVITPLGMYCYRRLPFGITSPPEYFQKRKNKMLDVLPEVLCMMDDMIIFGDSRE